MTTKKQLMLKAEEQRCFSSELGSGHFYPHLPKRPLAEVMDKMYSVVDAVIIRGWESNFGESDFALLLLEDPKDGAQFTTLCGGEVVIKKLQRALDRKLLPLNGTIIKLARYYDII